MREERESRESEEKGRKRNVCGKWKKPDSHSFIYTLNRSGLLKPNRSEPRPSSAPPPFKPNLSSFNSCTPFILLHPLSLLILFHSRSHAYFLIYFMLPSHFIMIITCIFKLLSFNLL
jgi:hypothetical protein